jgi:hypothetical protein
MQAESDIIPLGACALAVPQQARPGRLFPIVFKSCHTSLLSGSHPPRKALPVFVLDVPYLLRAPPDSLFFIVIPLPQHETVAREVPKTPERERQRSEGGWEHLEGEGTGKREMGEHRASNGQRASPTGECPLPLVSAAGKWFHQTS